MSDPVVSSPSMLRSLSFAVALAALPLWAAPQGIPMEDLIVTGALHTLDPDRPHAEAALIRGGKFICVGARAECEGQAGQGVQRLDLGAGSAVPGLADAHGHVASYGRSLLQVACNGARSAAECGQRAAQAARLLPADAWVRGRGWDQNHWPGAAFPTAAELSRAVPGHPVLLTRVDGHATWLNERALRLAGINKDTQDPAGGKIVRGPDGAPTGVLIDNAMELAAKALPEPADGEIEAELLRGMAGLVKLGLTSVHDCGVSARMLEVYRKLAEAGRMPIRVYAMLDGQAPRAQLAAQLAKWKGAAPIGRLTVRAVKLYADGALGSRGALLFAPYSDDASNEGLRVTEQAELRARVLEVAKAGLQPCVHAIGDRACSEVLHAFAEAGKQVDLKALRPRVEHLQILQPRELPLLVSTGAIASMQPTHATSDAPWAEARLGHGTLRQKGAYAWKTVLDAGVPLACGSDFPIEDPDPRAGLFSAEVRRPAGAAKGAPAWMPEQRLTRLQALQCFTRGVAYAEHAEGRRGMIKIGFDGDLTAFGKDVMAIDAEELPTLPITATVVGGKVEQR